MLLCSVMIRLLRWLLVLLQTLQLVRVQAAVAVGMDGRLIEIVCTAPLEQHKLLDGFKVNVEHIAAQRHFSDISGQKKRSKCYADERGARNI